MTRSWAWATLRSLLLALAMLTGPGLSQPVHAAELLMFELEGCPWCKLWHAEIGSAYPRSPEGLRAPLRIVDLKAPAIEGVRLDKPVRSSPTFVLVEDGREVGRITGYPGADFFWPLLGDLIAKLDQGAACPRVRAPGQRSL